MLSKKCLELAGSKVEVFEIKYLDLPAKFNILMDFLSFILSESFAIFEISY
jgi:hypothetical protein